MLWYITASVTYTVTFCAAIHAQVLESKLVLRHCCCNNTLTFECTVAGGPFDTTVWRGSAFDCLSEEISLLHSRFTTLDNNAHKSCNNGSIAGGNLGRENRTDNLYTSQLNVTVTPDIIGKSIECIYDGVTNTIIGSLNITLPDCYPVPVHNKMDFDEEPTKRQLIFKWNSGPSDCCNFQYNITASNCGTCPTATTNNTVTCTDVPTDGSMCTLAVQTVVCEDNLLEEMLISVNLTSDSSSIDLQADTNAIIIIITCVVLLVTILTISAIALVWLFIRKHINSRSKSQMTSHKQVGVFSPVSDNVEYDSNYQTIRIFDNKNIGIYALESIHDHNEATTKDLDKLHLDLNSLLYRLQQETASIASQWYPLGLSIGVPKDFLIQLKGYPESECLVELLDYWLRHHPSQPTWKEIIDAQKKILSTNMEEHITEPL